MYTYMFASLFVYFASIFKERTIIFCIGDILVRKKNLFIFFRYKLTILSYHLTSRVIFIDTILISDLTLNTTSS